MTRNAIEKKDFHISDITVRDLPEVIRIEENCFSDPWRRQQFLDVIWNGFIFWKLTDETMIGGYLVAIPYKDSIHIANIVIVPSLRRQGFARKFLRELHNLATHHKKHYITLEVRCSNKSAIALYESEGYYQFSVKQGYYDGNEDALLFVQELTHARVVSKTTATG